MYVRDLVTWQPIGCVVINVDRSKRRAEYQMAVLNPKDRDPKTGRALKFDRKEGQRLAMERLLNNPTTVRLPAEATQHDITMAVLRDVIDSGTAPARAVKFAKAWVREISLWFSI